MWVECTAVVECGVVGLYLVSTMERRGLGVVSRVSEGQRINGGSIANISIANINADADGTFTHVVVEEEDDY